MSRSSTAAFRRPEAPGRAAVARSALARSSACLAVVIKDVDLCGLPSSFDCERMPPLESRFVVLLTCFDLDVVSRRGRLVGILDMDFSSKRKVTIRVSVWIWLAVWQVG